MSRIFVALHPDTIQDAARQKARWIAGIALAGWDRLGWSGGLAERWMRLRDRRAPIAAIVLAAAYLAVLLWGAAAGAALFGLGPRPAAVLPGRVVAIGLALLGWRMAWRAAFTAPACGWRMAALTPLHMVIGNVVAMAAAVRAIALYVGIVRHGRVRWDKTAHVFPAS